MLTHDCNECPLANRRAFLGGVARFVAALVAADAIIPDALSASLPEIHPLETTRDIVRYPLPTADGASIDRQAQVILVRYQTRVFAFSRTCPHQRTALRWRAGEGRFQCPKHESKYKPDGTFISGRATRGMDRYLVARDGANIVVDTAQLFKQDDDPVGWEAACVDL